MKIKITLYKEKAHFQIPQIISTGPSKFIPEEEWCGSVKLLNYVQRQYQEVFFLGFELMSHEFEALSTDVCLCISIFWFFSFLNHPRPYHLISNESFLEFQYFTPP
ncbi:hypothetical protein KUTeg_006871 [Tegillarca granosa]|uniref:Uncharacterized protein n=1 Tax=Tegillarca granosa TaxID=220873 RepID=A0ABQ9FBL6_TEGGR|nr:hypothetical protein KUTeg_006871 [Tegillarca granosa]